MGIGSGARRIRRAIWGEFNFGQLDEHFQGAGMKVLAAMACRLPAGRGPPTAHWPTGLRTGAAGHNVDFACVGGQ
eukprot:3207394-Prymnesium_polylepis.1